MELRDRRREVKEGSSVMLGRIGESGWLYARDERKGKKYRWFRLEDFILWSGIPSAKCWVIPLILKHGN